MAKTMVFITNQRSCDRIIYAAKTVAGETQTELNIVQILDDEYELNPAAIDYLYALAKQAGGVMRIVFTAEKLEVMRETIAQADCVNVLTGMPSSHKSVLYDLWKEFPGKRFHAVDETGEVVAVAQTAVVRN